MIPPASVVEYDPQWPVWFAEIRSRLTPYLEGIPHTIEHVGSTAVPGLAAKPIIDVDVVVPAVDLVPPTVAAIVAAGYQHEGDLGIPGREAFTLPADAAHHHHLYVVVEGNKAHLDHMLLRDHLRADAGDRERYAALKRELAHLLTTDRAAYVEPKAGLVEEILQRAAQSS
ncbi:GrpB family protein [Kribbella pittospori]|uniref:GrpB family protein n=1 Tax=Kribbella pittospori TaxID=722689 RepID=UPI0013F3B3AD|nr:GrpB family protein [Kribbella pittospori]